LSGARGVGQVLQDGFEFDFSIGYCISVVTPLL
jgi:hypothetical protein